MFCYFCKTEQIKTKAEKEKRNNLPLTYPFGTPGPTNPKPAQPTRGKPVFFPPTEGWRRGGHAEHVSHLLLATGLLALFSSPREGPGRLLHSPPPLGRFPFVSGESR